MERPSFPSREDGERLKQEQQFARQIMFVADQAFADRTPIAGVIGLRPPEGRRVDHVPGSGDFVRLFPSEHMYSAAAE
jgi:hypothetical protein